MSIYAELYALVDPLLLHYRDDLEKHDREWIEANPGIRFVHMTRQSGTILIPLYPHDHENWPSVGQFVPYLFGRADRDHILRQALAMVDVYPREHTYAFCNGIRIRPMAYRNARQIVVDYIADTQRAWRKKNSRIDCPTFGRPSVRRSIDVVGINGVHYFGTYYESAGDYCRLTARKHQPDGIEVTS